MDETDNQGLLKTVLGFFAWRQPVTSPARPESLRLRTRDAWLRTDAYLQHDADVLDHIDPERLAKTLSAFENYIENDPDASVDLLSRGGSPLYPKLRKMRKMIEHPGHTLPLTSSTNVRVSKRKRDSEAVIEELSNLDKYEDSESKRRRMLQSEGQSTIESQDDPGPDIALQIRSHLIYLDWALRNHWICVCRKCSGLSVRLSLPQADRSAKAETSFEVFFGVRSPLTTTLQEAKITIKDVNTIRTRSTSEPFIGGVLHAMNKGASDFAHLCQSITESLGQRNCLHLALDNGVFQRLRPQPKTFDSDQSSRTVSLSALFQRQQELRGSSSALPLKGKRILALTLATALLPFLETPWLQPSFNHSKIQFFQPLRDEELPDITKPFLALEHIPIIPTSKPDIQTVVDSSKHMVHPNASVLALGILLCELHYCTPVELMQKNSTVTRNVNTDYYTVLDMLKSLEVDAGVDYYLAIKACLQWEYYPPGQQVEFKSRSVQQLFYQNIVKRLEAELFKSWHLRPEDLSSLKPRDIELCWGSIGREVIRTRTGRHNSPHANLEARLVPQRSMSDNTTANHHDMGPKMTAQTIVRSPSRGNTPEITVVGSRNGLHFFDAYHEVGAGQEDSLSRKWMDNLLTSIYQFIDPFETAPEKRRLTRIAILDSGFDPSSPLLISEDGTLDPRIKAARSFVHQSEPSDVRDEIGHGTHALGLLLQIATCAEIYIAKIAQRETLSRNTYDDIARAINFAVSEWKVDVISMSFGIREYNEPMKTAISNALHAETLLFAAASNDGANFGRAFPAKYPSVFCIHSTDGNGNPSAFNPTADDKDVNFSLLGEKVSSYWPIGMKGHDQPVYTMSGTSVATPIAAGLAACILSFVSQQEQYLDPKDGLLWSWIKDIHSMDAILKSMVKRKRGAGYDYITPHTLFDSRSSRDNVYDKIKEMRNHMYD